MGFLRHTTFSRRTQMGFLTGIWWQTSRCGGFNRKKHWLYQSQKWSCQGKTDGFIPWASKSMLCCRCSNESNETGSGVLRINVLVVGMWANDVAEMGKSRSDSNLLPNRNAESEAFFTDGWWCSCFFFRQFSEAQIRGTDRLLIPLLVGCFNSNHGGSTIKILGNPAKMVGISVMWWKTKCVAPTGYHWIAKAPSRTPSQMEPENSYLPVRKRFSGGFFVCGPEVPWKRSTKPYQVLPWWTPHAVCPSTVDWDLNLVCASDRLGCWETLGFIPNQIDGVIENENPWFTVKMFPNQSIVPSMFCHVSSWVKYGQVIGYLHNSMVSTTK